MAKIKFRAAKISDVKSIQEIINLFASKKEMLPRSLNELYESIQEYFVAIDGANIAGCAAIRVSWEDLAEIKGLAVPEKYQGRNIGKTLVKACEKRARLLEIKNIFALTFKPDFFIKLGYEQTQREKLPHKIWGECVKCHMFPDCGEVAVIKNLI